MPKLIPCPSCRYTRSWVLRRHHRKCKKCRKEWSAIEKIYPVKGFRLTKKEWLKIIFSFLERGTILEVSKDCRLSYATSQKCVSLIRELMTKDVPESLQGICEADETYVGGSWKNKNIHIRRRGSLRGRGTEKQAILGIIQRYPALLRLYLIPNSKGRTTIPIIASLVKKGSSIYTDGHKGYRRLPKYGYIHKWVDHQKGEYVRGKVHTQTIDGYWGKLKTHLDSIGGIRKEYLPLFLGEHLWRYNHRLIIKEQQAKLIYHLLD